MASLAFAISCHEACRDHAIMERLSAGKSPFVPQASSQMLDALLMRNNAAHCHEDSVRKACGEAGADKGDSEVLKRRKGLIFKRS